MSKRSESYLEAGCFVGTSLVSTVSPKIVELVKEEFFPVQCKLQVKYSHGIALRRDALHKQISVKEIIFK